MRNRLRFYTKTALSAAMISLLAPFAIPLGPIPISFASLAVAIVSGLLGSLVGSLAVLLYLAIGAVGVPVFSGFTAGFGVLFGPSVGFFVGYLVLALVAGQSRRLLRTTRPLSCLALFLAGELALVSLGAVGYALMLDLSPMQAAAAAFFPFLIPALIKSVLASLLLLRLWGSRFSRIL